VPLVRGCLRVGLLAGVCVWLAAATSHPAGASPVSAAGTGGESVISPQYQRVSAGTTRRRPTPTAAMGMRLSGAPTSVLMRFSRPFEASYGGRNSQYHFSYSVLRRGRSQLAATLPANSKQYDRRAASVPPSNLSSGANRDARLLFGVAVLLAGVYVLFLACWFWATRDGRVGGAARL
jgi:hypothetical protein